MTPDSLRRRGGLLAPGAARLWVVSGYFTVVGLGKALLTALGVFGLRYLPAGHRYAYVGVAALGIETIGFFRTGQLVRRRRRDGAWIAVVCFALDLFRQASTRSNNTWTLSIPLVGLLLITSVWPYLE